MKFSNAFLLFVAFFSVCGCSTGKRSPYKNVESRERQLQEAYHRKYAEFEVSRGNLPKFERKTFARPSRLFALTRTNGIRLELKLGHRWAVQTNSVFRTESRYRLCDDKGRLLAAGESTFALEDSSSGEAQEIILLSDPTHHAYFIAEEQSWATHRYILFCPSDDADAVSQGIPAAWKVTYVWIPERSSAYGLNDRPHMLGLHSKHLYIEQDGHIYALPIDVLQEETKLSYSIG